MGPLTRDPDMNAATEMPGFDQGARKVELQIICSLIFSGVSVVEELKMFFYGSEKDLFGRACS